MFLKKILFYSVSLLIAVLLLCGLFFKRMEFVYLGLYLHFAQKAIVSVIEYYTSKRVVAGTICYPAMFLVLTGTFVYSALFL